LPLKQHLAIGQHHLLVARKRGHPVQAKRGQIGGLQHRDHARHGQGRGGIHRLYPRMGILAADEIAVDHSCHLDIVDVVALALGKAGVLHPLARRTHAFQVGGAGDLVWGQVVHCAASLAVLISVAACRMALTMF
jgi:hypothetical protein